LTAQRETESYTAFRGETEESNCYSKCKWCFDTGKKLKDKFWEERSFVPN